MLTAAYTANLTAIFATENNTPYVPDSINELISKIPPDIHFAALNNTQTTEYLQHSPVQQYQDAFEYMKTERLLYDTLDEALSAVFNDNIALITDSPYIEFFISRKSNFYNPDCTLTSIGDGQFSPGGYGLALTKNSPFTDDFSLAILELRRKGEIESLINEYFNYRRTCASDTALATSASVNMDAAPIDLLSFGGLFVILGIAIGISLIVLLAEHTFKHRNNIKTMIVKRCYTHHQEDTVILLPELRTSAEALHQRTIILPDSLAELRTSTEALHQEKTIILPDSLAELRTSTEV